MSLQIYSLDTIQTIIERIAANNNSLPKYIYFPTKPTLSTIAELPFENLLREIQTIEEGATIASLKQMVSGKDKLLNIQEDILTLFIAYNTSLEKIPDVLRPSLIDNIQRNIKDEFGLDMDVNTIWSKRSLTMKTLADEINNFKNQVRERAELYSSYNSIDTSLSSTEFELKRIIVEIAYDLNFRTTTEELFNSIQTNSIVPFASLKNFYKLYEKTKTISPDDIIAFDDYMYMLINERPDEMKKPRYASILMQVEGTLLNTSFELDIIPEQILPPEEFIDRLRGVFSIVPDTTRHTITSKRLNGIFYIPFQRINNYLMLDMILNDPVISLLVSVNESRKTTKKKSNIYAYFTIPGKPEPLVFTILTKKVDSSFIVSNPTLDRNQFPIHSYYTKISIIRGNSQDDVDLFQKNILKIITLYNAKENELRNEYQRYIPGFEMSSSSHDDDVDSSQKIRLRDIAPEVFLTGYSRKCPNLPTVISDEEAKESAEEGKEVMVFPKDNSTVEQRNYICNHTDHKFPGLRVNKLQNKNLFPFLPCCFKKNQKVMKGSKYRQYYMNEMKKKTTTQKFIFITNKFVAPGTYGEIENSLARYLTLASSSKNYSFLRRGVERTKSSVIECMFSIFNQEFKDIKSSELRKRYIDEFRASMTSPEVIALTRQENYDRTSNQITQMILDEEEYFDPKRFIKLLEFHFSCKIFLFTMSTTNGEMILPSHKENYYQYEKSDVPVVLILEHMGSESDDAEYPQCEIIVRSKGTNRTANTLDVFKEENDKHFINNLYSYFWSLNSVHVLGMQNSPLQKINTSPIEMDSQFIDSNGKCRILHCRFQEKLISLTMQPLPPFMVAESVEYVVYPQSISFTLDFIRSINATILRQNTTDEKFISSIDILFSELEINIPIVETKQVLSQVPKRIEQANPRTEFSLLNQYATFRKTSTYIMQYFVWFYSKYLREKSIDNPTRDTTLQFYNDKIIISRMDYSQTIPANFTMRNNPLFENDKMIIDSMDLLKRIVFALEMMISNNMKEVLEYHTQPYVRQAYHSLADFERYDLDVMFNSQENAISWLQNRATSSTPLYSSIQKKSDEPYFLKHNDIENGEVVLVSPSVNMTSAISNAMNWENVKLPSSEVSVLIYSYISDEVVKRYYKIGAGNERVIILAYKVDGVDTYNSLLKI